jgi:hypothetical protein
MTSWSDHSALEALRPLEMAAYLRAHGWREAQVVPGKGSVWSTGANGDTFEILLPLNPALADYLTRLRQAVETLALAEGRSAAVVWADLTTSGTDIVRVSVQRLDAEDGTLPLEAGVEVVDNARNLMLAAACATVRPRPYYATRKPNQALEYVSHLRLGQTGRGSYVVTILSRVPQGLQNAGGTDLFGQLEEPFDRRATATLARALEAVQGAAIAAGVSANLCQALVGMAGEGDAVQGLQFDFSWSALRPAPEALPRRVRVLADALPIIREAGRILQETSPQEEFVLRGMVVRLERPEGAAVGTVGIVAYIDGRPRRVNVELRGPDYDLAIRAHQEGQPVVCTGELVREGRALVLRNPRDFGLETVEALF